MAWNYDAAGRLAGMTYPDGQLVILMIEASPGYRKAKEVALLSCNTGKGANSLASRLAKRLGKPVQGASSFIWYRNSSPSSTFVAPYLGSPANKSQTGATLAA